MSEKLSLAALRDLTKRMPFNSTLGVQVRRVHSDGVTVEIPFRADLRNNAGVLHGGVTASIADVAVGYAVIRHFGGQRRATTVELKINYFRPIEHGKVIARARLLRVGNHLVVGSVEITDEKGRSAGFATVTYMLLP